MRIQVPNIFFKAWRQRIALVVFLLVSSVNGQVLINEFSASNSTQIEDTDFEKYSDWIELYNAGTNAQNIKGYFLTDDFKEPEKWQISSDLTIEAGGFLLVWASLALEQRTYQSKTQPLLYWIFKEKTFLTDCHFY